ncbi:37S ribosomal protein S24, mitochondrial [Agyrium rufum]|nr:37S ribosomal protein S24, mitochondrial [Agyrium rufum]
MAAQSCRSLGRVALKCSQQFCSRTRQQPLIRLTYCTAPPRTGSSLALPYRAFSTSKARSAPREEDTEETEPTQEASLFPPLEQTHENFLSSLSQSDRTTYNGLPDNEKAEMEEAFWILYAHHSEPDVQASMNMDINRAVREYEMIAPDHNPPPKKIKEGLMALGEDDEIAVTEDDEFMNDDINSLAHGDLEQHREIREYARIAAWEMPLLSKLSKPFEPPSTDSPLRFRHTTYQGETHPAARKIVLEFCPADLHTILTPAQRLKLIKLVGVRYNPRKDIVKMSCEMFESQAQNKRYLGDLVDTLIAEAKGEGESEGAKDSFDDVPVDFRHVDMKVKPLFPEAWKLGQEQKRRALEEGRRERELREVKRQVEGSVVDGTRLIEDALSKMVVPMPARLLTGIGAKGKKGSKGKAKARR